MIVLNDYIRFTIIFFIAFTGNALVFSFPLLPILLCIAAIFMWGQESFINHKTINIFLILSLILLYFCIKNIHEGPRNYDKYYFLWPIYVIFFTIFVAKINLFSRFEPPMMLTFIIGLVFLFGTINGVAQASGGHKFIFGANMLYRIFLFISILGMIYSNNLMTKLAFLFIGIYGAYVGGSRMGLLLAMGFYSLFFLTPYENGNFSSKKRIRISIAFLIFLIVALINLDEIIVLFNFLTETGGLLAGYLSYSGSIFHRLNFLTTFLDYWSLFGAKASVYEFYYFRSFFQYPHNFIAELIFYYGIFGVLLSLIIVLEYIKVFFRFLKRIRISTFEVAYLVIFPSTLASGDIVDGLLVILFAIPSFISRYRPIIAKN